MLLNILHPNLKSTVKSSVIATETQEAQNLIEADPQKKSLGFLAYSCVKPPVDLTFQFRHLVNLNYIVIWPSVGSQKSTGFEVLIKSGTDYITFGYGYLKSELGIVFYRGDIYSKYSIENIHFPQNFLKCSLFCKEKDVLSNASSVVIRIIRTNSSVPAIGKIEIWCRVATSLSKQIQSDVHKLWLSGFKPIKIKNNDEGSNTACFTETPICAPSQFKVLNDVPEEYLDLITWEIMAIPLVLPSGKIIDKSTLEKHNNAEASWGRPPSDPFTGQSFNDKRKPFLSFALKNKIDKFLLENCDLKEFKNVPRTVGRLHNTYIYSKPNDNEILAIAGPSSHKISNNIKSNVEISEVIKVKNNESSATINTQSVKRKDNEPNCGISKSLKLAIDTLTRISTPRIKSEIQNYNKTRFSYNHFDRKKILLHVCSLCSKSDTLFKISCSHLICRSCLLSASSVNMLKCKTCGQDFEKKNVERFHFV